jgi:hypothetical protein
VTGRPDELEGAPDFVCDFWGRAVGGRADEVDGTVFRFTITRDDSEKYPNLEPGMRLLLAKSTDGFVFHELLPPRKLS